MSPQATTRNDSRGHSRSHSRSSPRKPTPRSIWDYLRVGSYVFVLIFSLVALGIAAHFQSVLIPSDLTRFIPYALFTSTASSLASIALLSLVFWFQSSPFALKAELSTIGVIGLFWFILSVLTTQSPAEDAEVECYADDFFSEPVETSFTTETYHAQYRVLVAAACINAFFLLGLCVIIGILAFRHVRQSKEWVSYTKQPGPDEKVQKEKPKSSSAPLTALPARATKRTADAMRSLPLPVVTRGASRQTTEQLPSSTRIKPTRSATTPAVRTSAPPPLPRKNSTPPTPVAQKEPAPLPRAKVAPVRTPTRPGERAAPVNKPLPSRRT